MFRRLLADFDLDASQVVETQVVESKVVETQGGGETTVVETKVIETQVVATDNQELGMTLTAGFCSHIANSGYSWLVVYKLIHA